MQFTFDPDLYNLTDGRVLCIFKGVNDYTAQRKHNPGDPTYGPSVRWEFEIVAGVDKGKPCGIITGKYPTPKNSCIRVLAGIIGHRPAEKEAIDTSMYVGKYYMVTIADGYPSHQFPPQFVGATESAAMKAMELITGNPLGEVDSNDPIPY